MAGAEKLCLAYQLVFRGKSASMGSRRDITPVRGLTCLRYRATVALGGTVRYPPLVITSLPLAPTLSANHLALLVLAIGCGSLFFSHVNDAGFWLVKEYFGLTVGETIKSWSVMETVISVFGFALVMVASVLIT